MQPPHYLASAHEVRLLFGSSGTVTRVLPRERTRRQSLESVLSVLGTWAAWVRNEQGGGSIALCNDEQGRGAECAYRAGRTQDQVERENGASLQERV